MSQYKRIFIVGHSGAGKGVLAQAVAKKLDWQFIDADFSLEPTIGRSMIEIIGSQGEETFHRCLSDILSHQISKENIVVTTDDSIVCQEKNRKLLSSEFVINLKVSTSIQLERISHNRPLLPLADYKAFLNKQRRERDALYDQVSSITINSDDNDIQGHVLRITKIITEARNGESAKKQLTATQKDLIIFNKNFRDPIHLSDQQATVLRLLALGKTSKEIARDMNISYRTVEGYIAKLMELLGCSSSKELIALYYDQP